MSDATYRCGSRDYLGRARILLDQKTAQSLFYAAFELHCGIEARLQEYLDVQQHISKKKKQGWKIAELGKNLKHAFDDGDQVVEIRMTDKNSGESAICYYTPVRASLKKKGQQLGNYMHALKEHKPPGHKWWREFKELLHATYEELKFATTGTLCGPPLLNPRGGTQLNHELGYEKTNDEKIINLGGVGRVIQMSVNYLKSLPAGKQQS
jgi:hypothetical protein